MTNLSAIYLEYLLLPDFAEIANNMPGTWQSISDRRWVFFESTASNTPTDTLTSPGINPHCADITKCILVAADDPFDHWNDHISDLFD